METHRFTYNCRSLNVCHDPWPNPRSGTSYDANAYWRQTWRFSDNMDTCKDLGRCATPYVPRTDMSIKDSYVKGRNTRWLPTRKDNGLLNVFPQTAHWCARLPCTLRMWLPSEFLFWSTLPHTVHVSTVAMCRFRCFFRYFSLSLDANETMKNVW